MTGHAPRIALAELVDHLDTYLDAARFKDYCPNGLQVEGRPKIARLLTGVSACQALLDYAVAHNFDAILVHHGYFWRNESPRITGLRRRRLGTLIHNDISLIAYHLPLDAHPECGNNAQIAQRFGWQPSGHFGDEDLGWLGTPPAPIRLDALAHQLAQSYGREPLVIGDAGRTVRTLAWCSGGAQGWFEAAIDAGADAFITGEISEPCTHLARESGVAFLACGHHATERDGVRALGEHIRQHCGIAVEFLDVANPV